MDLQSVLDRIPYLAPHGLAARDLPDGGIEVRMPFRPALANYVGILHAGAIFTAAETAAGAAAWGVVPEGRAYVLLREARARWVRRAEGDVVALARVDPERVRAARGAFEESGRADVEIEVSVRDAAGEVALEGRFVYALRPRRET